MSSSLSGLRAYFLYAAASALVPGGPAIAQPGDGAAPVASPPASGAVAERSPFLGEWELDLTRMPDDYGPSPKRVTFRFEDVGSGEWLTRVEIIAPDDSVRRVAIRYRRDGQAVQGEGDTADGDTAAFHSPAPNVLVMGMAKDGGLVGVRVYAISADAEMTESAAGVRDGGVPFVRNFHFRRIR